MEKGRRSGNRTLLLTGDGKGKTTSALGMVLRAVGHGLRVSVIQFVKGRKDTGEVRGLAYLPGVEVHVCGLGFVRPGQGGVGSTHAAAARAGLQKAAAALRDPACGMVVLDEVCGAVALGLLEAQAVAEALDAAAPGKVVVMTGRDACDELVGRADTVSRVTEVRHGLTGGWPAQAGVEW